MYIKLLAGRHIEVQGKLTRFVPGDCVDVGKQTAHRWIAQGYATIIESKSPFITLPAGDHLNFTIFCLPFPFEGKHDWQQRNAIGSWARLTSRPDVLMLMSEQDRAVGDPPVQGQLARVDTDAHGTPLISSTFAVGQRVAGLGAVVCYVNADIIMLGLAAALTRVVEAFPQEPFLMVGRRWDTRLGRPIRFQTENWRAQIQVLIARKGRRRGVDAIDYFAFRSGLYQDVPDFAVGRSAWDNWLVSDAVGRGINVVDATMVVHPVHQEIPLGLSVQNPTPTRIIQHAANRRLYDARAYHYRGTTRDAPFFLSPQGRVVPR